MVFIAEWLKNSRPEYLVQANFEKGSGRRREVVNFKVSAAACIPSGAPGSNLRYERVSPHLQRIIARFWQ